MYRTFSCVYNGTFFEIYSFKARNTKKDQELIIKGGGMNLRLFEGLLSSCFSE